MEDGSLTCEQRLQVKEAVGLVTVPVEGGAGRRVGSPSGFAGLEVRTESLAADNPAYDFSRLLQCIFGFDEVTQQCPK